MFIRIHEGCDCTLSQANAAGWTKFAQRWSGHSSKSDSRQWCILRCKSTSWFKIKENMTSLHWKKIRMKEVQQFLPLSLVNNDAEWESVTEIYFKALREIGLFGPSRKVLGFVLGARGVVVVCVLVFGWFFFPKEILKKIKLYDKIIKWKISENICSAETCTTFWKYLLHKTISERRLLSGHNPSFIDTSWSIIFHGSRCWNNWNLCFLIWAFSFHFQTIDNHVLLLQYDQSSYDLLAWNQIMLSFNQRWKSLSER